MVSDTHGLKTLRWFEVAFLEGATTSLQLVTLTQWIVPVNIYISSLSRSGCNVVRYVHEELRDRYMRDHHRDAVGRPTTGVVSQMDEVGPTAGVVSLMDEVGPTPDGTSFWCVWKWLVSWNNSSISDIVLVDLMWTPCYQYAYSCIFHNIAEIIHPKTIARILVQDHLITSQCVLSHQIAAGNKYGPGHEKYTFWFLLDPILERLLIQNHYDLPKSDILRMYTYHQNNSQ